jgi:hypothetical protein
MIVYYIYVSVKVFLFLYKLTKLRTSQRNLLIVTVRFLISGAGLLVLCIAPIIAVTPFFYTALGESIVHVIAYTGLNLQSTPSILAFQRAPSGAASTKSTAGSHTGGSLTSGSLSLSISGGDADSRPENNA